MGGHSLVELTEHDNDAADIMAHMNSMYIYVLLPSWYIVCTDTTTVVTHNKCIYSSEPCTNGHVVPKTNPYLA